MIEDDLRSLRQVLARAIDASGLQRREIERALEIRNGSLGNFLDGSLDLRVEHLMLLARVLRVPPGDLLMHGCPQIRAAATHRLEDWIGPIGNATVTAAPATEECAFNAAEVLTGILEQRLADGAEIPLPGGRLPSCAPKGLRHVAGGRAKRSPRNEQDPIVQPR